MSDDRAPETPASPEDAGGFTLREGPLLFHAALLAGLVPGASLPIVGVAAFRLTDDARWKRRSIALGALDLCVLAAIVIGTLAFPADSLGTLAAPAAPAGRRPRLGVEIDRSEESGGARILGVTPGSPAAHVGVEAGERVVAIDDTPVANGADLRATIESGVPGASRHVRVRSASGEERDVWITPTLDTLGPGPGSDEACSAPSLPSAEEASEAALASLPFVGVAFLVIAALWALGARRGVSGLRFWPGFVLVLMLGPALGGLAAQPLCAWALDAGLRPMTLDLVLSEVTLTLLALAFLWSQRAHGGAFVDDEPRWGPLRTYATGLVYLFFWVPRALFLLLPLLAFLASSGAADTAPIAEVLEGARAGPIDAVLTLISAAVLAPIAEEALFRGALAPHLARSMGAWPALYVSAIVFGAMHVGGHGPFLVGPLAIGCVLAWARLRSRALWVPIALHATLNGIATTLTLLM